MASLASDHLETRFEEELFRFGSGQAGLFRQRTPQSLR
jgi:hypothetical protein